MAPCEISFFLYTSQITDRKKDFGSNIFDGIGLQCSLWVKS